MLITSLHFKFPPTLPVLNIVDFVFSDFFLCQSSQIYVNFFNFSKSLLFHGLSFLFAISLFLILSLLFLSFYLFGTYFTLLNLEIDTQIIDSRLYPFLIMYAFSILNLLPNTFCCLTNLDMFCFYSAQCVFNMQFPLKHPH